MNAPVDSCSLVATMITVRTNNGYTIGLLDAVAGKETARFTTAVAGAQKEQVVEPLTNYFMARVRKDLRQGASYVGVAATSTVRKLGGDPLLVGQLRDNASAL